MHGEFKAWSNAEQKLLVFCMAITASGLKPGLWAHLATKNSHPHATSQHGSFGPASILKFLRYVLGEHPGRLALEMKRDGLACSLEVCELSLGNESSHPHAASKYGSFGHASFLEFLRHELGEHPRRLALEMK